MAEIFYDKDINMQYFKGLTFWDSFEHISEPSIILRKIYKGTYIFLSIPIFPDLVLLTNSRHYRPDEHYWYFTEEGLINLFNDNGFELIDFNEIESELGRKDIKTFAFRRVNNDR